MSHFDVLIIGGGPAGVKCALDLGKAGKKVGLIEREGVGGTCLNHGCIPSKTYLYLAEMLETFQKAKRHGIEMGEPKVIWEEAKKRKNMNVKVLGIGLTKQLKDAGVEIIAGDGALLSATEVKVGDQTHTADKIVLAVGSQPLFPPVMMKGEHVISSTEMLDIPVLPKSLLIIGGGVIGVEKASAFAPLGVQVMIIEKMPNLIPLQDYELGVELRKSLEKRGCKIHLGAEVLSCQDGPEGAITVVRKADGAEETFNTDKALVAIGRVLSVDLAMLDRVGIKHSGRRVELNDYLQTSIPGIYMIGDSAFRHLTAYGAEKEGECVAAHILGKNQAIRYEHMPVTVFSHPEVGAIGLTEEEVKKQGIPHQVKKSAYAANAKAVITGDREGMVKMIVEEGTERVLGVHIIGAHATDLIHQAILPVMQKMTVPEWKEMVWSHPVISEVLKAALEA